jgi:large-conductance mechanosensitive channel
MEVTKQVSEIIDPKKFVDGTVRTTTSFKNELVEFISQNNVVGTCTGVIIALVTKEVVLSLVADIVVPVFILLLLRTKLPLVLRWIDPKKDVGINISKFVSCFITWILSMLIAYLFIKYTFIEILGVRYRKQLETNKPKPGTSEVKDDSSGSDAAAADVVEAFNGHYW